jgi:hypothetical protein
LSAAAFPQVLAEALGWIAEAVPEFGLGVMDVKGIIEWMKADLGSANAPGEGCLGGCDASASAACLFCDQGWTLARRRPCAVIF